MFHVPMTQFFILCLDRLQVGKVCQPLLADQNYIGQSFFRPPFQGPSLIRVSSAVLKRLLSHLGCSPLPSTKSDHWSAGRLRAGTACD